jgi:glycosyltransferase involved in cell wall biosynthesis
MSASRPAYDPPDQAGTEDGGAGDGTRRRDGGSGLLLIGIVRARPWRGTAANDPGGDTQRIRYRDLEALVRPAAFRLPAYDAGHVREHQRVVERAMRRGTVLPLPYGVIFRGRGALIRFLEDQYLVLDEGLALFEGHWEVRLHIATAGADAGPDLVDLGISLYTELRRHARAAVPFPRDGSRVLSAAFLVQRSGWIDFVEHVDELGSRHPDLDLDVTGPWPPYDFVRLVN